MTPGPPPAANLPPPAESTQLQNAAQDTAAQDAAAQDTAQKEKAPKGEPLLKDPEFQKRYLHLQRHLQEIKNIERFVQERKAHLEQRPQTLLSAMAPEEMTTREQAQIVEQLSKELLSDEAVAQRKARIARVADLSRQTLARRQQIEYQYACLTQSTRALAETLPSLDPSVLRQHPYLSPQATWYRLWLHNGGNMSDPAFQQALERARASSQAAIASDPAAPAA